MSDLWENPKLNSSQRDRFLKLVIKEVGEIGRTNEEILKVVTELKEGKNSLENTYREEPVNSKKQALNFDRYQDPYNLYKYLFNFNQNSILKSTCHKIDSNEIETIKEYCGTENYDFNIHYKRVIQAFENHNKYFAPKNIKALIRAYLTGKNYSGKKVAYWSVDKIGMNWSSEDLHRWSSENKGVPPHIDDGLINEIGEIGYDLQEIIELKNGEMLQNFGQLVLHFKNLFHIKNDNSFLNIFKKENEYWADKIEFEIDSSFLKNVDFFTDVDKLLQAYRKILELNLEQHKAANKPKIKLFLEEIDVGLRFSILHLNNIYGKTVRNTVNRCGSSYFNLIKNQINGLCNFYLEADFEDGKSYRVEIWNKPNLWTGSKPVATKLGFPVNGVKHVFELINTPMV